MFARCSRRRRRQRSLPGLCAARLPRRSILPSTLAPHPSRLTPHPRPLTRHLSNHLLISSLASPMGIVMTHVQTSRPCMRLHISETSTPPERSSNAVAQVSQRAPYLQEEGGTESERERAGEGGQEGRRDAVRENGMSTPSIPGKASNPYVTHTGTHLRAPRYSAHCRRERLPSPPPLCPRQRFVGHDIPPRRLRSGDLGP